MSDPAVVAALPAALAGLASFLSPCALPLVPVCATYVAATAMEETTEGFGVVARRRAVFHAALLALGFALVFVALGAGAMPLAAPARDGATTLQRVGGFVFLAFGVHVAGIMPGPRFLRERDARLAARPAELIGALLVGTALGAAWTPCVGPTLASILDLAGRDTEAWRGATLLAAYTAGLLTPFFAISAAIAWVLTRGPRSPRHLVAMERVAGVLLVVMGSLLLSGHFGVLTGFLSGFAPLIII